MHTSAVPSSSLTLIFNWDGKKYSWSIIDWLNYYHEQKIKNRYKGKTENKMRNEG